MNKPVISVVMVVCNVDRFLGEAIESILDQKFRDLEFIIVDFGSTDKSLEIISSYAAKDSRIKLHEIPHCGLAEARNAGCFLAQGKFIALMDADDISVPDRLMWQVEFMEKHPQVGVLGGGVEWIDATGKTLSDAAIPYASSICPPIENRDIKSVLERHNTFWQPTVLMRSEAFFQVGGYRAAFVQGEDYDLWVRISEYFEMANLEQVLFKYRVHPHQISLRSRRLQTFTGLAVPASARARRNGKPDALDSAKEITPALLVELGISQTQQQEALATEYRGWIQTMCAAGEWSGALNAALEMLKSSDWKYVERYTLANMYLDVARLYWENDLFLMSAITAGRAMILRPRVVGRTLRLFLQRLGLA